MLSVSVDWTYSITNNTFLSPLPGRIGIFKKTTCLEVGRGVATAQASWNTAALTQKVGSLVAEGLPLPTVHGWPKVT